MNEMTIYYDFIEEKKTPKWLVISNVDWTNKSLYLLLDSISNKDGIENFTDNEFGVSVLLSDLIINSSFKENLGINLLRIEGRIQELNINKEDVKYLVIRIMDIKEVMNLERVST